MKFADRVAVITGAARGIGLATAKRLGDENLRLRLADVDSVRLIQAARVLADDGVKLQTITADLAIREGAAAVRQAALNSAGRIDILANNAGGGVIRPTLDHSEDICVPPSTATCGPLSTAPGSHPGAGPGLRADRQAASLQEVAAAIAFLASDEASFIAGQVISVNGASSMF